MEVVFDEVKIGVDKLEKGMYVSRLDRPWLETPLPFQGFRITSQDDIEQVERYCKYVYVDVTKGVAPAANDRMPADQPKTAEHLINPYKRLRKLFYEKSTRFEEEVPKAVTLYEEFSATIAEVMEGIRAGKLIELDSINRGVESLLDSVIRNPTAFLWVNRLKSSDSYTFDHLITTAIWCAVFGRHLGLERGPLAELTLGGLLFDIGKAKLPTALLHKKEQLTEAELDLIRKHVDLGVRILAGARTIAPTVLRIVATHHERWNGTGYPQGLNGQETPVFGRIVGLIDSFTAMTVPRPFSPGISPHDAISEFYQHRGENYDAELVEEFIQACGIYPTGSLVELNTGEVAIVIGLEGTYRLRPRIYLLLDETKQPYPSVRMLNLSNGHEDIFVTKGLPPGAYDIDMEEVALG